MKRYTDGQVKQLIEELNYKLIDEKYKTLKNITIEDTLGYLYKANFFNLVYGEKPFRFSKNNPYTIKNIKLWCKVNDKPFRLLSNEFEGTHEKLKWKCLKGDCKEEFEAEWASIQSDRGCPFCRGLKVGLSNCLATKNPQLASEWNVIKNGNLTPFDVTVCYSKTEVWWKCNNNESHEWKATISSRNNGKGCPFCSHRFPNKEYNLLICNPILASEWNYDLNEKLPEDYCPNSGKIVWWKCKQGHEWMARISSRNYGNGCPFCNISKGEEAIKKYLNIMNIFYIEQKNFDGLCGVGNKSLSYDFYLPKHNLLIEYQGEQHDHYCKGFHNSKLSFEKQQEHDYRKKNYAKQQNIEFLEIWYYDFNNIESILNEIIK